VARGKGPHAVPRQSRAVLRIIEPGGWARCEHCGERVKFIAAQKIKGRQVICNRYVKGKWKDVVHYHAGCYEEAGEPYGAPVAKIQAFK
jgi:hypothetical protein